jgi:hypothetical protein
MSKKIQVHVLTKTEEVTIPSYILQTATSQLKTNYSDMNITYQ